MILAYSYRLKGGRCSGCSVSLQSPPLVCASSTTEEVWAISTWLVETAGADHPSPIDESSRYIPEDPSSPG
jgi:hypothetical protein